MASYFLYVFPLLQHLRPVALETQSTVCLFSAMMNLITAFLLMILIGKVNTHINTRARFYT